MNYLFPNTVMQIFCKAPQPGSVKTRLMPQLTATQAAHVHRQLTQRTLKLVTSKPLCPVQLWCTPSTDHPFFRELADSFALHLSAQSPGDLGQRMVAALNTGIGEFGSALLIGCDCPSLTQKDLIEALSALAENHDVVIAPTEDGGYSLIGLKQSQPEIFNGINWGTSEVYADTGLRISALNLQCRELNLQWDVDTYSDYLRYLEVFDQAHVW